MAYSNRSVRRREKSLFSQATFSVAARVLSIALASVMIAGVLPAYFALADADLELSVEAGSEATLLLSDESELAASFNSDSDTVTDIAADAGITLLASDELLLLDAPDQPDLSDEAWFTVTYDSNWWPEADQIPVDNTSYAFGDTVTVLFAPEPEVEGVFFIGWDTDPYIYDAPATYNSDGLASFVIEEDTVLYAVWGFDQEREIVGIVPLAQADWPAVWDQVEDVLSGAIRLNFSGISFNGNNRVDFVFWNESTNTVYLLIYHDAGDIKNMVQSMTIFFPGLTVQADRWIVQSPRYQVFSAELPYLPSILNVFGNANHKNHNIGEQGPIIIEDYLVRFLPGIHGLWDQASYQKVFPVLVGDPPIATPAPPDEYANSDSPYYIFDGWQPEIADYVTESVDYIAQWRCILGLSKELFSVDGVEGETTAAPEQIIRYRITLINSGDNDLFDVLVEESMYGNFISATGDLLATDVDQYLVPLVEPGQTLILYFDYELKAEDIGTGVFRNTINVGDIEDEEEVYTDVISIQKTVEAPFDQEQAYLGDTIRFKIVITNHSEDTLFDVELVESLAGDLYDDADNLIDPVETAGTTATYFIDEIEAGQSVIFYFEHNVVWANIASGMVLNVATASVVIDQDTVTKTDSASVSTAALTVKKQTDVDIAYQDDIVLFSIVVTNRGRTAITNIEIIEQLPGVLFAADGETTLALTGADGKVRYTTSIAQSEKVTFIFAYYVSAEDVMKGSITNTVIVDGKSASASVDTSVFYSVIYDGNGGATLLGEMLLPDADNPYKISQEVTIRQNSFVYRGYRFVEWNTAADGSGIAYDADDVFDMPAEDLTLYAQWEVDPTQTKVISYAVEYYTTDNLLARLGSVTVSETVWVNASDVLTVVAPNTTLFLPPGYRYGYTAPAELPVTIAQDGVIKVIYEPIDYTVTVLNSYAQYTGAGTYNVNNTVSIAAGGRTGYRFTGWTVSVGGVILTNNAAASTTFVMPAGNVTVIANWVAVTPPAPPTPPVGTTEYTVTFVDWDGTVLSTQTVAPGADATAPESPVRDGYTFTGWDIDFTNVQSDLTVTAQYATETFTVTFVDNDDNVISEQSVPRGGDAVEPMPPAIKGYDFIGWDTDFTNVQSDLTVRPLFEATIGEIDTPLIGAYDAWALVNFILMLVGVLLAVVTVIRTLFYNSEDEDEETGEITQTKRKPMWITVTVLFAILGVIFFFLTENMNNPMIMVDQWTVFSAIIFALVFVSMLRSFRRETSEEDRPTRPTTAAA
ncbi:MAG: InlB B-repeat-containing protein [Coriobacteriia bacterium]|nr:InlB B-repeat-containing protein [Coriobacteriia bacterium]